MTPTNKPPAPTTTAKPAPPPTLEHSVAQLLKDVAELKKEVAELKALVGTPEK